MEEYPNPTEPKSRLGKTLLVTTVAVLALAALVTAGLVMWHRHTQQQKTLLPTSVSSQIQGFDAYFYANQIPASYSLDATHTSLDQGVLIMPLIKPGKPTIVLTEQSAPSNLSQHDLQQNGSKVAGTIAAATINSVEGRLLGTMVAPGKQGRTLILLNAPGTASKDDISKLLHGLQPTRR